MLKLIRVSTVPVSLNVLLKGQFKFLSKYYKVTAISGSGKDLNEVQNREGVAVYPIEMERDISLLKDFRSLFKLFLFLKKEKPDIIHSITPKAGLISMFAGRMAGVPIRMHTFTGLVFPSKRGLLRKVLIATDKLLAFAATHIYPEGEGVKRDLIEYKITSKPLKVLANGNINGIETSYYDSSIYSQKQKIDLRTSLNILPDDFVFIFVGRLVKDKGINELVSSFKKLVELNLQLKNCDSNTVVQNSKLILVGSQEQDFDPLLPETLKEISQNPHIVSVGWQDDVRPYMAIADALVFPSYREGFPNVVMQAGAMGLPSIVTDINGCNEIIIERKNGVIIPPKDKDILYKTMKWFIENPQEVIDMAERSRDMICSRYEQQIVWDALLNEYKRVEKNYVNRGKNK